LEDVKVDLARAKIEVDFEVIKILYEKYPYLVMLEIGGAYENNSIINLKNKNMSFE